MRKKVLSYPKGVDIWVHGFDQRFFEGKKACNVFNLSIAHEQLKTIDFGEMASFQNAANGRNLASF